MVVLIFDMQMWPLVASALIVNSHDNMPKLSD